MKILRQTFLALWMVFALLPASNAYHKIPGSLITAGDNWETACLNLERNISYLENLDSKAGDIEVSIDVNNEELRDELLSTPQYYSVDIISAWASALSSATLIGYDIYDGIILHTALSNVASAINTQMDKVGTLNDDPAATWDDETASYFARRKKAHNDYVEEIEKYNEGHKYSGSDDNIGLPTQPETKHDVSRRTPPPDVTFYACKGGCGLKGPRKWSNTFLQYIGIPSHFVRHCQVVMHNDWKTYLVYGAPIKCGAAYYACEGRFICPNAHNHPGGAGAEPHGVQVRASDHQHKHPHNDDSSSNTVTPSASLSGSSSATAGDSVSFSLTTSEAFSKVDWYVAGPGVSGLGTKVETDTGGALSKSASFSYTFSDSGSYTITASIHNYRYTLVYQSTYTVDVTASVAPTNPVVVPAPPPPPTVTPNPPPPPPPPPPPTTVKCGRSGCSDSVSSANEHRVGPCSACGKSYWSCSWSASYWENEHRERTCRYGTCGNTWRRCMTGSSTPDCSSPNRQGKKCWAADP